VKIDTSGSNVDTLMAVYTGTNLASLVLVTSNDDAPSGGTSSLVTFSAQVGTAYLIAVDTFGGAAGEIHLHLNPAQERPALQLSLSARNLVLSWPTNAAGFDLEETESLGASTWNRVPSDPVLTGGLYSLKTPLTNALRFYRLSRP
jgi:hypothetical protein